MSFTNTMENWSIRFLPIKNGAVDTTQTQLVTNVAFVYIIYLMQRNSTNSYWVNQRVWETDLKIDYGLREATLYFNLDQPPPQDPPVPVDPVDPFIEIPSP